MSNTTVDINGGNHGVPYGSAGGVIAPGSTLAGTGAVPVMGGGLDYVPDPIIGNCHQKIASGEWCRRLPKSGDKYCPAHKRVGDTLDLIDGVLDDGE